MPTRARKQKTRIEDIRRVELIDAAHRIFLREGLKGLTTTKICAEAGMSQGILTYYFRDKDEVLFEMVRLNNRVLADAVVYHLKLATNDWERLIAMIDGTFPAAHFDRPTARAWISLYAEAAHNERYAVLVRHYYRRLRSNVGSILTPLMPAAEIDHFVRGFAAMIDGLWLRRGHSETDMWLDEARTLLIGYVERMLGPEICAQLRS
jgi:TetR/AcrR family transcriptional repressor of bet genes